MKKSIFSILLAAFALNLTAQNRIALQHNGQSSFFTSLETAYTASVDGDTIHLPGGTFRFQGDTLNKRLAIIGTGFNSDSSRATGISIIPYLTITSKASGGILTGITLSNGINIGNNEANRNVDGFSLLRCDIQQAIVFNGGANNNAYPNNSKNFIIQGCRISGGWCFSGNCTHGAAIGNAGNLSNFLFSNNLVVYGYVHINQSEISNNVIYGTCPGCYDPPSQAAGGGSIIRNNIFGFGSHPLKYVGTYYNNLNVGHQNGGSYPNAQSFVTYTSPVAYDSLFVDKLRGDYHLRPNYQTIYIGTDNTQIGIYGGRFPWKDGSMPFNPHISTFNVDPQTDNTGRLRLRATINAQRN